MPEFLQRLKTFQWRKDSVFLTHGAGQNGNPQATKMNTDLNLTSYAKMNSNHGFKCKHETFNLFQQEKLQDEIFRI